MIAILNEHFVCVAVDRWYAQNDDGSDGELFRQWVAQSPVSTSTRTAQGFYIASPSGGLYFYSNRRGPKLLLRQLRAALKLHDDEASVTTESTPREDHAPIANVPRPRLPQGATVVQVASRIVDGYGKTSDAYERLLQQSTGRDNLWVTRRETEQLVQLELPRSLVARIARFHLVDNTRGEPDYWEFSEVKRLDVSLDDAGNLTGEFVMRSDGKGLSPPRELQGTLFGRVQSIDGRLSRFDVIAIGTARGRGQHTPGAPPGEFTLAVAFRLPPAEKTNSKATDPASANRASNVLAADRVPPHALKGWRRQYFSPSSPPTNR